MHRQDWPGRVARAARVILPRRPAPSLLCAGRPGALAERCRRQSAGGRACKAAQIHSGVAMGTRGAPLLPATFQKRRLSLSTSSPRSTRCLSGERRSGGSGPSGRWNRWQLLFAVLFRLDGQTLEWRVSEILHNVSRSWIQINGTCFNAGACSTLFPSELTSRTLPFVRVTSTVLSG